MHVRTLSLCLSLAICWLNPAGRSATFTVTTTADSGAGSLRQALLDANANAGPDVIDFNIQPAGEKTITLLNTAGSQMLPVITEPVTIDGTTQPGFAGKAAIELNGTSVLASTTDGLRIVTSNCVIRGLVINRFRSDAIEISGGSSNVVEGCILGLNLAGSAANANAGNGINITNSIGNVIGGSTDAARNIISGNTQNGVLIDGTGSVGNMVRGNYIGTDLNGSLDLGNGVDGIRINSAPNSRIGGVNVGNLISGNNSDGIEITGATALNNTVFGNNIGVVASRGARLGNSAHGVHVSSGASGNMIGAGAPGQGNLIAFNGQDGIYLAGGTNNTLRANATFSNLGLGIDLDVNGATANDVGDADVGANERQNFPVLTAASAALNGVMVTATLNSAPNLTYTIDVYGVITADATGGEGEEYLGSMLGTTDAAGNMSITGELPSGMMGRFITATATDEFGNTSEFGPNLNVATTVVGETFTVTTTADSGAGSLRQAILDANMTAALDTIVFNIPGEGPHTITNLSALPAITNSVVIDGYTQPGAAANTDALAFNGVLKIILTEPPTAAAFDGLNIQWPGVTVRGLNIIGMRSDGIEIGTAAHGCVIEGCVIGLDLAGAVRGNSGSGINMNNSALNRIGGVAPSARNVLSGNNSAGILLDGAGANGNAIAGNLIGASLTGLARAQNNNDGIRIVGGSNNVIGGTTVGARNIISGNAGEGIEIGGTTSAGNVVQGNYIGPDVTGNAGLRNTSNGIFMSNARNHVVGGSEPGAANLIAFNDQDGVFVNSGTGNAVRANAVHSNNGLGIDIDVNGVTVNDVGDGDVGGNQKQNFPTVSSATVSAGGTAVEGMLSSGTNITYTIDFYSNVAADPTGNGEGQQYLGSTTATTDENGNASFGATLTTSAIGKFICATATDPAGNTSEFSACAVATSSLPGQMFTVTTTADSGAGSLRQAILEANALFNSGNTIAFIIPGEEPHTITPTTALPAITGKVTIDGYSQPGAAVNTSETGFNATLKIVLNGSGILANGTDGLSVQWPDVKIRGLSIISFRSDGIEVGGGAANCVIEGCVIGLDLAGADMGNGGSGIYVNGAANALIGGSTVAARNVISGNQVRGVDISGATATGNRVLGNFIGVGFNGKVDVGNSGEGIFLFNGAHDNVIGGATAARRNVISGNGGEGVELNGAAVAGNVVLCNYIGSDATGLEAVRNDSHGVVITSGAHDNRVGGAASGEGNRIAFNNGDGVSLGTTGGANNSVRGNSIVSNTDFGIDLGGSGVLANDAGDADAGVNALQNYPMLTSALAAASGTTVRGSLNSRVDTIYTLDFYSSLKPESNNVFEGDKYLGSAVVTTDASGNATFDVTVSGIVNGRFITATATDPNGNTSEFSPAVRAESTIAPATLLVTTTADSGPGSLRQALLDAGNYVSGSPININFQIPGSGPHGIAPVTELPAPTEAVLLNGYSQTGATANTLASGNNAVIKIHLSGANLSFRSGLKMTIPGNVFRGLAITGFGNNGLELLSDSNRVEGCFVGLAPNGTVSANSSAGIRLARVNNSGGRNNVIGGSAPAARNVISGNSAYGLWIEGGSDNVVQGNYIGTNPGGTAALGNGSAGIYINNAQRNLIGGAAAGEGNLISGHTGGTGVSMQFDGVSQNRVLGNIIGADLTGARRLANNVGVLVSNGSDNVIGGVNAGEGNTIAFNEAHGVHIYGFSARTGNAVRGNSIHSNGQLAFELGFDSVTENDAGDGDDGANLQQNFPTLTSANATLNDVTIAGTLNGAAISEFTLDFYANILPDDSGNGEGEQYLGSTTVTTAADGNATFNVTLPKAIRGRFITATATDAGGNTSEFSDAFEATTQFPPETFVVSNTNNEGLGSLRQAILANNSSVAGDNNIIAFNIPGPGPHQIIPTNSPLPAITHAVTIDGFTQPGATANSLHVGNSSALKIAIVGDGRFFGTGFNVRAANTVIRGLSIRGFTAGVSIFARDVRVSGCWLGLLPDGSSTTQQSMGILLNDGANGALIGGTNVGDRNVIAGHASYGIQLAGTAVGAQIQGNYIGTSPSGTERKGNGGYGIYLSGTNHVVGGSALRAGNLIAGNTQGISLYQAHGCVIQGNLIGADAAGLAALGGNGPGIEFGTRSTGNLVGGAGANERNVISGNGGAGISLPWSGSDSNRIVGNFIGTDITGGAALGNSGDGIYVTTSGNQIGGAAEAEGNVIAHNGSRGVAIAGSALGNSIRSNLIFSNPSGAIDLSNDGPTANDGNDADTGANNLQNYPVITAATLGDSDTTVEGALNSAPNQAYEVDFFANEFPDASGFGQGRQFLGTATVTTGGDGSAVFSVTLPRPGIGRYITATATDPQQNTSEFAKAFRAGSSRVPPMLFEVTTTADSGPGSLRQAMIDSANYFSATPNYINFKIPGDGPHTISLLSSLPSLPEPVDINGFTQPGAASNSESERDNAVRLIHLDGSKLVSSEDGFRFTSAGNIVRGLVISKFPGSGIIFDGADDGLVEGCMIFDNRSYGVNVNNSQGVVIGRSLSRNIIHSNPSGGVIVQGPSFGENRAAGNRILGNFIGMDANGNAPTQSQFYGVYVAGATSTEIGGATGPQANWIAFNNRGVVIQNGQSNRIRGNRIYSNSGLGIDLNGNGATSNDPGDADSGANGLQNFPALTSANVTPGGVRFAGTLSSAPNSAYTLDFYWNAACDNSGSGEGARYIGQAAVTTDASGNAAFNVTIAGITPRGVVSATATDANGNTSEFSSCATVGTEMPPQTYLVTSTNDSGPGSLRQAIVEANESFTTGANTIAFNIPGAGVRVIVPASPLPDITSPVMLDGLSQPGARANSAAGLADAVLAIRLDGANAGDGADGLRIAASDTTVRGFMVTRFKGAGIRVTGANNVRISENVLGGDAVTAQFTRLNKKQTMAANPGPLGNGNGLVASGTGTLMLVPDGQNGFGNQILNNTFWGVDVTRSGGVFVAAGDIDGNGEVDIVSSGGLILRGATDARIENSTIVNNTTGLVVVRDGNVSGGGLLFINNIVQGGEEGIRLAGPFATLSGNTIGNINGHGIVLDNPGSSGQPMIIGNTINNCAGFAVDARRGFGVNIGGSTEPEQNLITGNGGGVTAGSGVRAVNNTVSMDNLPFFEQSFDIDPLIDRRVVVGSDTHFYFDGKISPNQSCVLQLLKPTQSPGGVLLDPFRQVTVLSDSQGNFTVHEPFENVILPFLGAAIRGFEDSTISFAEGPEGGGNSNIELTGPGTVAPGAEVFFRLNVRNTQTPGSDRGQMQTHVRFPPHFTILGATLQENGNNGALVHDDWNVYLQGEFFNESGINVQINARAGSITGPFSIGAIAAVNMGDDANAFDNEVTFSGLIANPVPGSDLQIGEANVSDTTLFTGQRALGELRIFDTGEMPASNFRVEVTSPSGSQFDIIPAWPMGPFVWRPGSSDWLYNDEPLIEAGTVPFGVSFPNPGTHTLAVNIVAPGDANPGNNARTFVFNVANVPDGPKVSSELGASFGIATHNVLDGLSLGPIVGGNDGLGLPTIVYAGIPFPIQINSSRPAYVEVFMNLNQDDHFTIFDSANPSIERELTSPFFENNGLGFHGLGPLSVPAGNSAWKYTLPIRNYVPNKPIEVMIRQSTETGYNETGAAINGDVATSSFQVRHHDIGVESVTSSDNDITKAQMPFVTVRFRNFGFSVVTGVKFKVDPGPGGTVLPPQNNPMITHDPVTGAFSLNEAEVELLESLEAVFRVNFTQEGTKTVTVTVTQNEPEGNTVNNVGSTIVRVRPNPEGVYDYGDAPEVPEWYPTTEEFSGAKHLLTANGPRLGFDVQAEADGQPSPNADGDGTEEDGVIILAPGLVAGRVAELDIWVNKDCYLDAWIDFDGDGDFDAQDYLSKHLDPPFTMGGWGPDSYPLKAGPNLLRVRVPITDYVVGPTYARFRVSSEGGLNDWGAAADGEVEDYLVEIKEEFDFGDAPDTYKTTDDVGGAKHVFDPDGPLLGANLDFESDGAASPHALGDDTRTGDDEDGVIFRGPLVAGVLVVIEVTAPNGGELDAWIDWMGDGVFDASDYVSDNFEGAAPSFGSYTLNPGVNNLRLFAPNTGYRAVPTFARFRISRAGGVGATGLAMDGEVEDYQMQIFDLAPDFGDAPEPYPTLLANGGAYHLLTRDKFYLGSRIDFEANGFPSATALGDDADNGLEFPPLNEPDDEDGVTFARLLRGTAATVTVNATIEPTMPAKVDAWIDFNQNNSWIDSGEKVLTSANLVHGANTLQITVPANATLGKTFARFRMSRNGNLGPGGLADSGEVEDYQVEIVGQSGPPTLTYSVSGSGQLVLTFGPNAVLESAPTVLGPWTNRGQQSPFTVDTSVDKMFFRAVGP